MADRKDSLKDWEKLAWALREVFPRADYGMDKKITETWGNCMAALHHVLRRHVPGYDFEEFDAIMTERRIDVGLSKRDHLILRIFAVFVGILLLIQYNGYTMEKAAKARIAGHGDVWATICEDHPKIAEQLMIEHEADFPRASHCKDFEHHFEENP